MYYVGLSLIILGASTIVREYVESYKESYKESPSESYKESYKEEDAS